MESQDSLHGSSEEKREEGRQTKGTEEESRRKSVMKMKAGVKGGGGESQKLQCYLKDR